MPCVVQAGEAVDVPGVGQFNDEFFEVGLPGPVGSVVPQPGEEKSLGGCLVGVGRY